MHILVVNLEFFGLLFMILNRNVFFLNFSPSDTAKTA
jgi:hypothetical protein